MFQMHFGSRIIDCFVVRPTRVYFNQLTSLDVELSTDFFNRFPRIKFAWTFDKVERDRFKWFLQNATVLLDLQLIETWLDQIFMDNLSSVCSQLTNL